MRHVIKSTLNIYFVVSLASLANFSCALASNPAEVIDITEEAKLESSARGVFLDFPPIFPSIIFVAFDLLLGETGVGCGNLGLIELVSSRQSFKNSFSLYS